MGRRYDRVLMISRRATQILWTNRRLSERIAEKPMDFSKSENRIEPHLWVIAEACIQHKL
jgi:hypothetical protein